MSTSLRNHPQMNEMDLRIRCFMDGLDWQYHLEGDDKGTLLYPDDKSLREGKPCIKNGCGVVEVEVRLIRWVEEQEV